MFISFQFSNLDLPQFPVGLQLRVVFMKTKSLCFSLEPFKFFRTQNSTREVLPLSSPRLKISLRGTSFSCYENRISPLKLAAIARRRIYGRVELAAEPQSDCGRFCSKIRKILGGAKVHGIKSGIKSRLPMLEFTAEVPGDTCEPMGGSGSVR